MEQHLRRQLYTHLVDRQVAFNPVEPEPFDLVDLTQDVTNSTHIYHLRTECVREALTGATLIVTDSQPLAEVVKRVLPKTPVVALPFGLPAVYPPPKTGELVIGLLNHTGDVEMNNAYALPLLKALGRKLLIYTPSGAPKGAVHELLPDVEATVTENFKQFAATCDILLCPSLPGAINSITLPLTLMATGTVLLCHNAPGYYDLDAATGVQLLPNDPDAWLGMLSTLEAQPARLRTMQARNRAFALRLNQESLKRAASLFTQVATSRVPLSEGCDCAKKSKKSKKAPTQPSPEPTPIDIEGDEGLSTHPTQPEKELN